MRVSEDLNYQRAVEAAAERFRENGHLDLCDLADAGEQGFHPQTFTRDVERVAKEDALNG